MKLLLILMFCIVPIDTSVVVRLVLSPLQTGLLKLVGMFLVIIAMCVLTELWFPWTVLRQLLSLDITVGLG